MDNFVALRLASSLLRLLVGTIVALSSVCAQNTSPLHLEKEIPLPGVEGRIDHFSADVQGRRLFIAALENGTVEVIDIRKGERFQITQWPWTKRTKDSSSAAVFLRGW